MKHLILGCFLLLSVAIVPHSVETTPNMLVRPFTTAEATFTSLANDVAALLRRALAEPNDIKALDILQGPEASRLLQRQKQQRPVFQKWLNGLSPSQRQAFAQRTMNNDLMRFMQSVDQNAQANARIERNAKLGAALTKLVTGMYADKM